MKVGDLVMAGTDTCESGHQCGCWFCSNGSSRIGMIVRKHKKDSGPLTVVARHDPPGGYWSVLFDAGECNLYGLEMKVISESR